MLVVASCLYLCTKAASCVFLIHLSRTGHTGHTEDVEDVEDVEGFFIKSDASDTVGCAAGVQLPTSLHTSDFMLPTLFAACVKSSANGATSIDSVVIPVIVFFD